MYELPADFDPSTFVGQQLTSVLYAEHMIGFSFADTAKISIWGTVKVQESPTGTERAERPVAKEGRYSAHLLGAVGRTIARAEVSARADLKLIFDGDFSVTVTGDAPMYECYLILLNDREIVENGERHRVRARGYVW